VRKRRPVTALTLLGLVLLAACTSDDDSTPTPEVIESSSVTAIADPTSVAASTPRPTTIPSRDIFFCGTERDGLVGFIRYDKPRPSECNGDGFVLQRRLPDGVVEGDFVPRCLQPDEDHQGLVILVGHLCLNDDSPRGFTTDPRPPELRGQLVDGDVIPFCTFDNVYPDYPITVGPPCIYIGLGPASIALDEHHLDLTSDCTAGFTYFSLSETALRALLDLLPTDASEVFDTSNSAVTEARTALSEPAPERVARFFALWGDKSPIEMNARIVEAVDALNDGDTEGLDALRTQIQDAIDWYTAGRGC